MGNIPSKKELRKGPDDHGFQVNTRHVVGGIIAFALVVFIAGNSQDTKVQFLFVSATMPLWIVLAGTALVGAAIGALLTQRRQRRKSGRA
ncbi:MAG: LapA family protein [Microthrixaceae bacterium]